MTRCLNRCAVLAATMLLLAAAPVSAQTSSPAAAKPRLEQAWFKVEFILFERTETGATAGNEDLVSVKPRAFPRHAVGLAQADGERIEHFRLTPAQIEALALPEPRPDFDELLSALFAAAPETTAEDAASEAAPDVDDAADVVPGIAPDVDAGSPALTTETDPLVAAARAHEAAVRAFEAELVQRAYLPLPAGEFVLTRERAVLTANRDYAVVAHQAWLQPVPPREAPLPLLLQAGQRHGDHWTYEGTLAITLGRFLHVHANLWRTHETDELGAGNSRLAAVSYERLEEQRRVRSAEIHHLDHPHFGVLIRIDPILLPPELGDVDAFIDVGED
jgi:hypothetical protein